MAFNIIQWCRYFDIDVVSLRMLPFKLLGGAVVGRQQGSRLNNAVLYAPRAHPYVARYVGAYLLEYQHLFDRRRLEWGSMGPASH